MFNNSNKISLRSIYHNNKTVLLSLLFHVSIIAIYFISNISFNHQIFISDNNQNINIKIVTEKQITKENKKNKEDNTTKDTKNIKDKDTNNIIKQIDGTTEIKQKKDTILKNKPEPKYIEKNNIPEINIESINNNNNNKNIEYKILKSEDPHYPIMARKLNYKEDITIETKLLIDLEGRIEKIEFINKPDNNSIYHLFQNEVLRALTKWEFSPIKVNNKIVKVYYYKNFKFTINQG